MIARNVIDKCNKEQTCEMKVAAAIKTTIWRTSCAGQAVGTNFIQVNYTCVRGRSITRITPVRCTMTCTSL